MRAVEEVEFRPADGPGKILLGRWTADIYLEDCLKQGLSTGVDNEDCA